jgi:hypothetical protein
VAWRGLGCERVIAEKPVERRARSGSTVARRRPHAPFRECRVRGRVRQTRVLARTQLADRPAIDRKQQSEVHPRSLPVRTSCSSPVGRSADCSFAAKQQRSSADSGVLSRLGRNDLRSLVAVRAHFPFVAPAATRSTLLLQMVAGPKRKRQPRPGWPTRRPLVRETSSDAVGSSEAGTAQTRQHSLPRGGRLLVSASSSQRVCWRTYDRRAELAVWSCRVRRSVAARAASFSRPAG